MALYKKDWWKIKPKGSGNASAAFGVFDEIFHPQAYEATQTKEEQNRLTFQTGAEGDSLKITIKLPQQN